jgi:hypothetical protein
MIRFWRRSGGAIPRPRGSAAEAESIMPISFGDRLERLATIEREARHVLAGLDDLGQHQAAAYVAMAIDAMRRVALDVPPTG